MSASAGVIAPDRGDPSAGGYVLDDALTQRTRDVALPRNLVRVARRAAVRAGGMTSGDETEMFEDTNPTALAARLATGDTPVLLDVREPWEHAIAALPGSVLIPLGTLQQRTSALDAHAEYVVYCHHGGRSAMAAQWLRSQGFARVANLEGGIDAWSLEVDASVPRY